jgi:parallel beta-helix repeat protein
MEGKMKKCFTLVLIIFLFLNKILLGQPATCAFEKHPYAHLSKTNSIMKTTSHPADGAYITAHGTLRVLVVFAQFLDDNSTVTGWTSGSAPDSMSTFIDSTTSQNSTNYCNITNYYKKMSINNFNVIGKAIYVKTPSNRSHYKNADSISYPNRYLATKDVIQNKVDPIINFNLYDNWRSDSVYTNVNTSDNVIDMIIMIWRGLVFDSGWLGEATLGGGNNYTVEGGTKTVKAWMGPNSGSGITIQFWGERDYATNFHSIIHEFGHWLFGPDHPYQSDWGGYLDEHAFWGMLRHSSDGICANAYEREQVGWITPTTITGEISDASMNDFVTTGAAYKYHPSNGSGNEYYYFENHQQLSIYDNATRNTTDKGILILHFQDKYKEQNNIRCRTSNGDWNWELPFNSTSCFNQLFPAFRMVGKNRYGRNSRDFLPLGTGYYFGLFDLVDNNNYVSCAGYEYGEASNNSFNTSYNRIFAPWSNPSSHTWDNQETNFEMQVLSNGNTAHVHFYLGNMVVTENTTLPSDTYNFTGNVTIASNVTLTIAAGSTINFTNGTQLIVNGTLTANGVTFTRSGSSGTWGGIQFNSGSSGGVQYCNINYANVGIYCNNTSSPTISHNNINNTGTYGIWLYNSSPTISYNTITTGSNGIYCQTSSSPIISHNTITGQTYYGLSCFDSDAYMANSNQGNNVIRQNGLGLASGYESVVYLSNGNNCVHNNSSYEVYAVNNSVVNAENTWWNYTTSPYYTTSDFLIQNYSSVDANPNNLRSDPNGCPALKISTPADKIISDPGTSISKEITDVLLLEQEGKYEEAITNYMMRFKEDKSVDEKSFILIRLAKCYLKANKNGFIDFLNNEVRVNLKKDDVLYAATLKAENEILISGCNFDKAISNFIALKDNFSNNEAIYKPALYNLGTIYNTQLHNSAKAKEYFNELKTKYPNDELTFHSQLQLGESPDYTLPGINYKKVTSDNNSQTNEYDLLGNYPNPFNPTTKINYQLPENGFVTLKVYDILGREVASLVNENEQAGNYSVAFDASKLSSGIYIYTIHANDFVQSKKMILMK